MWLPALFLSSNLSLLQFPHFILKLSHNYCYCFEILCFHMRNYFCRCRVLPTFSTLQHTDIFITPPQDKNVSYHYLCSSCIWHKILILDTFQSLIFVGFYVLLKSRLEALERDCLSYLVYHLTTECIHWMQCCWTKETW
jgi:hypothetical protein